jgi:hypothetical protein
VTHRGPTANKSFASVAYTGSDWAIIFGGCELNSVDGPEQPFANNDL